jgi:endogenous inhibitor of DNA gyrase (YacG/DUF329 family)
MTDWPCPECGGPTATAGGAYSCYWCERCQLHFNRWAYDHPEEYERAQRGDGPGSEDVPTGTQLQLFGRAG